MNFLKKYKMEICCVSVFAIFYIGCCSYYMIELPHMTWFDQIPLIDKFYSHTLNFRDLMSTYGEHGMFGTNILFLLNTILFKMSTLFDVYLNDLNVLIVAVICVYAIRNTWGKPRSLGYYITVLGVCFFAFNILQESSGAMETQVRLGLLFCVLIVFYIDSLLHSNKIGPRKLAIHTFLVVCGINIFGTLYSFAVVPAIICWLVYRWYKSQKIAGEEIFLGSTYLVSCVMYILQYHLLGKGGVNSGLKDAIISLISAPNHILMSLIGYCGSFVLGYPALADGILTDRKYIAIGGLMLLIMMFAIYIFFAHHQYTTSMMPILLIAYSLSVWFLVLVGRYAEGMGEWQWMTNYWYYVHVKLAMVGIVWILGKSIFPKMENCNYIGILAMIAILIMGIFGESLAIKRLPNVKAYYIEKQPYLFAENIDELPVDDNGNTPLLHNRDMTMNAIKILKKYNLSVYRYYSSYEKMCRLNDGLKSTGIYDDGWVEPYATLQIKSGNDNKIILNGWYNKEILKGDEIITVSANNQILVSYQLTSQDIHIEVPCESNTNLDLVLESNFSFQADAPDTRTLSFILNDIIVN